MCHLRAFHVAEHWTQTNVRIAWAMIIIILLLLFWDVTVTCPLADSYISAAARESGAAAEIAASRKEKYADLDGRYIFEPIAIDTLGVLNTSARQLLCDLDRNISEHTGKSEKRAFCFKDARCSCNVSMPYYFTTVYLPLTAPADWSYPFCIICNF